jgi:IS5 family transposase
MVLSLLLGAANRPDQELATPAGGRRRRPEKVHGDKGYDARHCRAYLRRRGITARIARKAIESSQRLGRHRWQAEQSIAWLFGCRRLRIRYDRGSERFYGFGLLACCRLAFNRYTDRTTLRPDRPGLAW